MLKRLTIDIINATFVNMKTHDNMESVFANRLIAARKMAGLSLQGLANKLGNIVTRQALNKYEQGIMKPNSELVIKLSEVLNVTVDFFFSKSNMKVQLSGVDFRRYSSKLTKTEVIAVQEKSRDILERYFELEDLLNMEDPQSYFSYPSIIKNFDDAEAAAKKLRTDWNLGYDPIPDVVEMLEDKGYKVVEVEAPESFDGLKAQTNGRKVIVLRKDSKDVNIVRKRLTALHELAHHSLKFPEGITSKGEEKLCNAFASAVLYPEEMVRRDLHKNRFNFYQNELQIIKERWGISFTAIFNRALILGIINDYVYKRLNIGYRGKMLHKNEPGKFLSRENPVRFERLIFLALAKELISINEAAYYSGTSVWSFRERIQPLV
jgi:Zn-dependent peptidase ImmA (M78 family)/DNA-binding XRE family transcriptional regulator